MLHDENAGVYVYVMRKAIAHVKEPMCEADQEKLTEAEKIFKSGQFSAARLFQVLVIGEPRVPVN